MNRIFRFKDGYILHDRRDRGSTWQLVFKRWQFTINRHRFPYET